MRAQRGRAPGARETSAEPGSPDRADGGERGDLNLLGLVNVLLRHRRAVFLLSILCGFLALAHTMRESPKYTASTTFYPQGAQRSAGSQIAGLASQFGVDVGGGGTESINFYAELMRNREITKQAVITKYRIAETRGDRPRSGNLVELLQIKSDSNPRAVDAASRWLRSRMGVRTDSDTGTIQLSVSTRWPSLSLQLADRMIQLLDHFNLESRQSQAKMERTFIEGQLDEAEAALLAAEDSLSGFLQRNRRYENSPELIFEVERLQRRVALRQAVYTSLAQSLEQVRMREVRNTPVITVLEPPELPLRADSRGLLRRTILGVLVGMVLGGVWAFGRDRMEMTQERDPDDYAEFRKIKEDMEEDVGRVLGWLPRVKQKIKSLVGRPDPS